mmetsp:Transcript_4563/g.8472  ORF Transcript_4563/g.8472 Transcript_4563/m.8472 type:complete len:225 (-) Transcript_4563:244-918(-)
MLIDPRRFISLTKSSASISSFLLPPAGITFELPAFCPLIISKTLLRRLFCSSPPPTVKASSPSFLAAVSSPPSTSPVFFVGFITSGTLAIHLSVNHSGFSSSHVVQPSFTQVATLSSMGFLYPLFLENISALMTSVPSKKFFRFIWPPVSALKNVLRYSLFISNRKAPSKITRLDPKIITKFLRSAKVSSERSPFAKSNANTNASARSGRNMFSEKYNPPTSYG